MKDLDRLSYEEELRELGLLTLRKRRLGEETLSMCISIRAGEVGGVKEIYFILCVWLNGGMGCPGRLWVLHP